MNKKITKAVIPAAGFATRFLPVSKAMPKQMLPLVDKPVIQYVVEQLVEAGIEDIIIVTNYHERAIEDHFDRPHGDLVENLRMGGPKKKHLLDAIERVSELANFAYVRQKGPYGNGTPLLNVRHLVGDEPFIYAWSDEFFLADPNPFQQLVRAYETYGTSCIGCIRASSDGDYTRFGYVDGTTIGDGAMDVKVMVEKPGKDKAPSDLATISPYIFTPDIFHYVESAIKNTANGSELYWNDVANLMLGDGKKFTAVELKNAEYCDSGTPLTYLKTVIKIALRHPDVGEEFLAYLKSISL